jgi:hypothetical protein
LLKGKEKKKKEKRESPIEQRSSAEGKLIAAFRLAAIEGAALFLDSADPTCDLALSIYFQAYIV